MEWLTTGQMIDHLRVGEVAENESLGKVKRFQNSIKYVDDDGNVKVSNGERGFMILVNNIVLKSEWRILPNYVSFEEATKALNEGKDVRFHPETPIRKNQTDVPVKQKMLGDSIDEWHFADYTLAELLDGKWSVDHDSE